MRKSVWLLSAGLIALSYPAHAQDVQDKPETDTDQGAAQPTEGATAEGAAVANQAVEQQPVDSNDIVVTATRRNEALSDVPLAVSAVTAERLEYTGATDIRQLNQVSPSLLVSSTSSEAAAGVARIRGIGTVGENAGLESSVGVFIDGVYRSRTGVGLTELGPLDRIEVLRGPQGTLFGRNTSAGLISIITARPQFQTLLAAEGTIGNYDLRRIEGSANAPITESLAARLDAVYMRRDGFLEDVISGRDVNDRNRFMVRGQALYEPTDDLSVRFVADLAKRREECCAAPYLPVFDTVRLATGGVGREPSTIAAIERGLGGVILDDTFDRKVSITPGRDYTNDVDDWGVSGEVVYDFGGAELTSISAYRYNDLVRGQDSDFNNLDILFRDSDGGSGNRFKTLTQELRLQGEAIGGRLDWLVGGYFAHEKLRVVDNLSYGNDYAAYANCLVANSFATNPAIPDIILAPGTSPTCFNTAVATGVRGALIGQFNAAVAAGNIPLATQIAGNITTLSAFARLNNTGGPGLPVDFTLPIFGPSGFSNLATVAGFPGLTINNVGIDDTWNQTSNNWALFTHNIFTLLDGVDLTVGARYTHEKKKLRADLTDNNALCALFSSVAALQALQQLPCINPGIIGATFSDKDSRSENKLSGTVVLSWKPTSDILTYASYSRGYKAGGFNLDRAALTRVGGNGAIVPGSGLEILEFKPETNDAIELGMKYNGQGIDVNLALFHQLFKNFQLNTFNGLNFIVENINSCDDDLDGLDEDNNGATGACTGDTRAGVKSVGAELEIFTRPLPNVSWNLGMVYADTRYRNNLVGANGLPLTSALFQLPGRRISNSAEWTATSSFAWTPPIGGSGMRGLVYADVRHMSQFNTGSDLDIEKVQDAFTVVNARIGLHGPDQAWGVELWAQNLLDEDYMQVGFDAPIQGSGTTGGNNTARGVIRGFYPRANQLFGAFLGEPRTYGLTLRAKWGPSGSAAPTYEEPPAPPPPPPPAEPVVEQPVPPPPPPPPPAPERG